MQKSLLNPKRNRKQNQVLGPSGGVSVQYSYWGFGPIHLFCVGWHSQAVKVINFLPLRYDLQICIPSGWEIWTGALMSCASTAGQPWATCPCWRCLSQEGWTRWPPEVPSNLNCSEILLSFWNITSLPSDCISEWMQSIPLWFCTDLDCVFTVAMIETWLLYLVSQRGYERKCHTGGLGIDLLNTNTNKEVVDFLKSKTLVTQGSFFSDWILEVCSVRTGF